MSQVIQSQAKHTIELERKEVINMPNYYPDIHIERCTLPNCNKPVERGLAVHPKNGFKYLNYLDFCKEHNKGKK